MARLTEIGGHEPLSFLSTCTIPAGPEPLYFGGDPLPRKYVHTFDLVRDG
jgi:hypothetical protein